MPDNIGRYSIQEIKDGFEKFLNENGHYPTVHEIDQCLYLPSSRQIQRNFGGVVNLRKKLNLSGQSDYSRGEARSKIAAEADKRAKEYEEEFYKFLTSKIDRFRVHEHKIIRPGGFSSDFFVYVSNLDGIIIDLFYAKDFHSLSGIVTIKSKKDLPKTQPIFFILVGNDKISQKEIDVLVRNRKNPLPKNIEVLSETYFKENFGTIIKKWMNAYNV